MNYVTLIISSAAPQKTLQRLTIKVKEATFFEGFFNFLFFMAIQKKSRTN